MHSYMMGNISINLQSMLCEYWHVSIVISTTSYVAVFLCSSDCRRHLSLRLPLSLSRFQHNSSYLALTCISFRSPNPVPTGQTPINIVVIVQFAQVMSLNA